MRRVRALVGAVVASIAVLSAAVAPPGAAAASAPPDPVMYTTPVDAPLVDRFRPPGTEFAAGNRGVDYAALPGDEVHSAAPGEVVFSGPVGGQHHVVVLHADGIRTSYSFLASRTVRRGDRVGGGQVVGTAGGPVHFGARAGGAYLDPLALLGATEPAVHLVADDFRRPLGEVEEQRLLADLASKLPARAVRHGRAALAWARNEVAKGVQGARDDMADRLLLLRTAIHYVESIGGAAGIEELNEARKRFLLHDDDCTPATETPPPFHERRIAVLVGGLGSSTGHGSILDVDTAALGYAPTDVVQFSYRRDGPYTPEDTGQDIRESARNLTLLLEDLRLDHPGVKVDVIAHSQGGLVARTALAYDYDPLDPRFPPIGAVVTLGTPHHGTDLATMLSATGTTDIGEVGQALLGELGVVGVDPRAESIRQMSEVSDFLRDLNDRPLPKGVPFTSIAARNDTTVPNNHSWLDGARNVVVTIDGSSPLRDHDLVPGSATAHREVALALGDRPPTCTTLADVFADTTRGILSSRIQDTFGALLTAGALRVGGSATLPMDLPLPAPPGGAS